MKLCNRVDKRVLKEQIANSNVKRTTLSFYKYAQIGNPQFFRDYLFIHFDQLGVLGRVYVADEGINAQISVPEENIEAFKQDLEDILFLRGIRLNIAVENKDDSFYKLVVKNRTKILADGLEDVSFDVTNKGLHLGADEFNDIIQQDNTILIDMRNHYETEVGHFKGAVTPDVDNFRESLPYIEEEILNGNEDKNIVMYCTGGIRCEKASAWYKHRGFKNVYQLEGGIIKYAHEIKAKDMPNLFIGKNFVFDERLEEAISPEVIANCHTCGNPFDSHSNCANVACNVLFIQCVSCKAKLDRCCSEECQSIHALPEEEQKVLRKGEKSKRNVFKKGRSEKLIYKK
mgnify:FL=1|jgi:UPF0176 protein|tara:strand:+ start:4007 stop:5038 length:1032 start_codon:yes stop_codon:yes gene_type:complete